MKNRFRLLLVVTAALFGLAFAGPALASFAPFLTVQQSSYKLGAGTTAGFLIQTGSESDDPIAKISIFSPAGYANTLNQAPGTVIGKALAYVLTGGIIVPLTGDVVVRDPAAYVSNTCAPGAHQAVWELDTSIQGNEIKIPAYVDVVPTGPYVVQQICLQSPSDPAGAHAQLLVANYTIKGVFTNAATSNGYQWSADFTPYLPGTIMPNPAGTVEWRNYVGLPSSLTFKRAKSKASLVAFSGQLKIAGLNPGGIKLHLYSGPKTPVAPNDTLGTTVGLFGAAGNSFVKTKPLKSSGKYSVSRKRPKGKKKTYFQMRFEDYDLLPSNGDKCEGPSPSGQPIPCNGTSLAPLTSSNTIAISPKRR
jgi:hypothetical protein